MIPKVLLLAVLAFTATAWAVLEAGFKDACTDNVCSTDKNLVCNQNHLCECKLDDITHAPWVYVDKMEECIPVLRESGALSLAQQHGGHQPGWGNSAACITINTPCYYSTNCQQAYGNLAECKLHSFDPELNRCQCCHPTEETGFYNNKCYFVKRIGDRCQADEECMLGASNSECLRGSCSFRGSGGNEYGDNARPNPPYGRPSHNEGGDTRFLSVTLIITAQGFFNHRIK